MASTLGVILNNAVSIYYLLASAVAGISIGFALRLYVNYRQKKTLLKLEDKMLRKHAQILYLESKLTRLQNKHEEPAKASYKKALKAS